MCRRAATAKACRSWSTWWASPAGGRVHANWKNFGENAPERLDRLIGDGAMAPCVVAFPDCFTKLGGNQYVNSVGVGAWDDFLLKEAVPFVERKFGCGGPGKRGV